MKTKLHSLIVLILLSVGIQTLSSAQNLFDNTFEIEDFKVSPETVDLRTYEISLDDEFQYDNSNSPTSITQYEAAENAVAYALSMIAFGGGFGFTDLETLWCLHAAYYLRLAMLNNSAVYGALGAGYNYVNGDFLVTNLFDVTLRVLMFSVLAKQFQQVRLQYGVFARYAFGTNKFPDGFKNDITRLSFGLMVGLHILLTTQWSLMVQTNVLTHQEQTIKSDGSEIKDNETFGLINKNNLLLLSLVFTLPNSRRR